MNTKKTDGEIYIDPITFEIETNENPELIKATLDDALNNTGKKDLYVPEEHRIYQSTMYLEWHQRYQDSTKSK